jgi:DNA-binding CsgD family transcriptional regulator
MKIQWLPQSNERAFLILTECEPLALSVPRLRLTKRETEVLSWIVEGKSNPEIGIILGTSPNTVRKHVEHLLGKLSVETRAAAVRKIWDIGGV